MQCTVHVREFVVSGVFQRFTVQLRTKHISPTWFAAGVREMPCSKTGTHMFLRFKYCLSVCLSVCPSVYLTVCLSVCLSVSLCGYVKTLSRIDFKLSTMAFLFLSLLGEQHQLCLYLPHF